MKRYLLGFAVFLLLTFFANSNPSPASASTIFSDDLKTSYSDYTPYFSSCSPTTSGYNCNGGLVNNKIFTNLKCVSADIDNADFYSGHSNGSSIAFAQIFLTDGGSNWLNNLVGLVLDNNGYPDLYTGYTGFPKINSSEPTPSGIHNWTLCKNEDTFTAYIDGKQALSYVEPGHSSVSFAIGGVEGTEFTNLKITDSLPTPTPDQPHLSVIPLKQNAGGWENMTYDLANIWSPANPSIGTWGCALTSAAMVLNYYNIHTIPQSNLSMTPGNLDAWLGLQPDGYIPNGNLNWLAIQRLTKQAKADNPTFPFDALEYKRSNFADTTTLLADLNANQPDILEEPGHFIVATGQSGSTYTINDPYYNRPDLTSYGNTFLSLGRYIPSFTDLSYMLFTSDPSLTVTLKDNTNTPLGTSYTQQPLHGAGTNLIAGNPINLLYLQNPGSGNYTLTVSGTSNQIYTIKGFLYDTNGNVQPFTHTGVVNVGNPNTVTIGFNPQDLTKDNTVKIVTDTTLLNDITNLYKLKHIQFIPYNILKDIAKDLHEDDKKEKHESQKEQQKEMKEKLTLLSKFLNTWKNKGIDATAYQILSQDIQYLQTH